MNKLLIATSAILAMTAGSAMAVELTDKLAWNTELTTTYNATDDVFSSDFETGLSFQAVTDVSVYGTFYVDAKAAEFTGSEFGVVYTPSQVKPLTASAYVTVDDNFENEKAFVEVSLKF
jgi:hypothetical protein